MKTNLAVTGLLIIIAMVAIGDVAGQEKKEIVIGALIPLTGDWASQGAEIKAALEVGVDDINRDLDDIGSDVHVVLKIEDTGLDPATALRKLQDLNNSGIRLVIAGGSSEELEAVRDYADKSGIIVIGTSSTSTTLSIPRDNILRFVPDDAHQGEAVADLLKSENISAIVPLFRGDTWGIELLNATRESFQARGGKVLEGIKYEPGSSFSDEIKALSNIVNETRSQYGSDKVGVYLVSLDEATASLALAAEDSNLSSVRWFGSDGTANLKDLVQNTTLAEFAIKTDFINPIYSGADDQPSCIRDPVQTAIAGKLGFKPFVYALVAYDALKAAAISTILAGENATSANLKGAVIFTANGSAGSTGILTLNDAGDRANARYDFVVVGRTPDGYSWKEMVRSEMDSTPPSKSTTTSDLVAFVHEAVAYAHTNGKERALEEFSNKTGSFVRGELYIYAYDFNGINIAHPFKPDWIGKSKLNMTDSNGVPYIKNLIDVARVGEGFTYFIFPNPAHGNRDEYKIGYAMKVDDSWWLGSGIYLS